MFNFYNPISRWLRRFSAASLFVLVGSVWSHAATFYSRPAATNFADVASWSSNTNGIGGSNPASISNADDFIIANGSNLVLNASASVRTLTLNGGRFTVAANTLTIAIAGQNNSTLLISGDAQFNQTGGSVVLDGNMDIVAGASFFQSGGTFTVDGNSGTAGTSVSTGTAIVRWAINSAIRLNLTGGTFTIVDPHLGATVGTDWTFNYNSPNSTVCGTGHNFQIGNGVSTQAGGHAGGFIVEGYQGAGRMLFGNLIINTATAAGNRHVSNGTSFAGQTIAVLGNMTINSGSEYRSYSYGAANAPNNLAVGGNLTNNGTLVMPGTLVIGSSSATSTTQPSNIAQTIGGTGTFQNGHPSFSATFQPLDANYVGLTINNSSSAGVTFNAKAINNGSYGGTVRGTLTFTRGLVNASAAPFILGISAATRGTLSYTAGGFTSGTTFGRWYPALAEGATFTAGSDLTSSLGRYPFVASNLDKSFFVRLNSAPATGGTISVLFTNANTNSAVSITDGAYTVESRHDANWTVSSSGITGSPTVFLGARIPGSLSISATTGSVRLCGAAAAAPGVHQSGLNSIPCAQRITVPFGSLAGTYYMGVSIADQAFVSVASGNYNSGSTWNKGTVPTATDVVTIGAGTTVTLDDARTNAGTSVSLGATLTMAAGANLTIAGTGANLNVNGTFNGNAGTASIGSLSGTGVNLGAGGQFNVAGATINLGPQDNSACNRVFTQTSGTLNVTSGNLNIAGRYTSTAALNPKFIQSGGAIRIDGNAGGVLANSISGVIFDLQVGSNGDVQLSGGSLTIVDPSPNTVATNTFAYTCTEPNSAPTTMGHSTFLGDGVSTDAGGNATNQFRMVLRASSGFLKLCNLVIRTGSGTNRAVTMGTSIGIYQNLTINSGSTWNAGSGQQVITGDFIVNGTAIMSATFQNSGLQFPTLVFVTTNIPTTIGGTGTIQNLAAAPTAQLTGIYMDNSAGITLNRSLTMSGAFSLVRGEFTTTAVNDLTHISTLTNNMFIGATSAGYIKGPFRRVIPAGAAFNTNFMTFPVGKTAPNWLSFNLSTAGGTTTIKVETFDANSGTPGLGLTSLNSGRRWQVDVEGTNNIGIYGLTCYDNNIVSGNALAQSATAGGAYDLFGGSALYSAPTAILPAALSSGISEPGTNLLSNIGFGNTGPLSISNVLATQQTGTTTPGASNVSIMRYGIAAGGSSGGITLTDLVWTYTGSNAADIATNGVSIWQGTFTAPTGVALASASLSGGTATFSGLSIPIVSGNNFVWIRVNTNAVATIGNTIDGRLDIGNLTFSTSGGASDNAPQPAAALDPAGNILIDYCTPTYTSGCGGGGDAITNVTLASLNNSSACAASPYYTFYNAATKPALTLGNPYTVNVSMGTDGSQYSAVWIDFDRSGTFDATEYFTAGTNAGGSGTSAIAITVPGGATLGDTRMRVRGGEDNAFTAFTQACGASSSGFGETEDYIVTIVSPAPRSIDPIVATQVTGGVTRSATNANLLRIEIPVAGSTGSHTLSSLKFTYTGTSAADIAANGVSLWTGTSTAANTQVGTNLSLSGGAATFSGLSVALNPGSNFLWIRVNTSASAALDNVVDGRIESGDIVINEVAPAVAAGTQPPANLDPSGNRFIDYCVPTYANGGTTDIMTNVVLNGVSTNLSNASGQGAAPLYYTFFNSVNVPDLYTGSTYPINVSFGTDGNQYVGVWIDFNKDGAFATSEFFTKSGVTGAGGTATFNIVVPPDATLGNTRMRIRGGDDVAISDNQACGASNSTWGETEDYIVSIIAPPNCSTLVLGDYPASATTPAATTVCAGDNITLGLTVQMPSVSGLTYQWRRSGTNIGAPTAVSTLTTPVTLTGNYDAVVRCNAVPVAGLTITPTSLTVNSPSITGSTPATTCGPGSKTVSATGSVGTTVRWYDAATGGNFLASGNSYVTPILSATTNYYAAAANLFGSETGGATSVPTTGFLSLGYGVVFTASSDLVLNTTTVYPVGTGDFTIALYNSSGVELASTPAIAVSGGTGAAQVVNLNFDVAVGAGYRLGLKNFSGITSLYREFISGFPYNSSSGALSVTAGYNGASTTGAYYYFYNIAITKLCVSPRTTVAVTYTPPPLVFISASPAAICGGQTSTGNVGGFGYTSFTWDGGSFSPAGSGATKTLSPSSNTTYTVTATGGGCTNTASVSVTVNPAPTAPVINTITPAGNYCFPGTKTFAASATPNGTVTIFNEGFNSAGALGTWTLNKGGSFTGGAIPDWSVVTNPLTYSTQITNFTVSSSAGNPASGFAYINSDQLGSGTYTGTFAAMSSPVVSSVGYSSLQVSFRHVFRSFTAAQTGELQYSIDGGTVWTSVYNTGGVTVPGQVWNAANIQTTVTTVNLPPACDNQPNLRLRFRYNYDWDYYWMLDDVQLNGTPVVEYVWSSNFGFAGIPSGAQSFAPGNNNMVATPTQGGAMTYTVQARNANGCLAPSTAQHSTNVSQVLLSTSNSSPQRENTNLSLLTTPSGGFGGYSYVWTKLPSPTTLSSLAGYNVPTAPAATTGTYRISVTDGSGCNATEDVDVLVYAAIVWNGSQSNSWTNPLNWTPNIVPANDCAENVAIPQSANPPVFPGPAQNIGNFIVEDGGALTLNNNINVCGSLSGSQIASSAVTGTGTISLTGSSNQSVAGKLSLDRLIINKTGGQVNFTGTTTINDLLTISNNAAILNVTSGGNVVLASTVSGTGKIGPVPAGTTVTVNAPGGFRQQRYIPVGSSPGNWYFLGSPMENKAFTDWTDDFSVTGLTTGFGSQPGVAASPEPERSTIFKYNESQYNTHLDTVQRRGWRIPGNSDVINNGEGYRVFIKYYGAKAAFDNAGLFKFGDKTWTTLTRSSLSNCQPASSASSIIATCPEEWKGWNLIANPYPCPIDWDHVSWAKPTTMNNAFYTWDALSNGYRVYVGSGGSALGVTASTASPANVIPSSQAVFVKFVTDGAISPSLKVTEAAKVTNTSGQFVRSATVASNQVRIRMSQDGNSQYRFDGMIRFDDEATTGFDIHKDADVLSGQTFEYHMLADNGQKLIMNSIPVPAESYIVPMGMDYKGINGNFRLNFLDLESVSNGVVLYLKDNFLGTLTNVSLNPDYGFAVGSQDGSNAGDRFELVVSPEAVTSSPALVEVNGFAVYPNPSLGNGSINVMVKAQGNAPAGIAIIDMVGKEVYTDRFDSVSGQIAQKTIRPNLPAGVYTIKVQSGTKTYTEKLVIR